MKFDEISATGGVEGILLGLCMDVIYQAIVLKTFYPGEAVIVALALAFLPYLLLRGPIAHRAPLARRRRLGPDPLNT